MKKNLPKELTGLVDWSVTALGDVIRAELGHLAFRRIENIRRFVKTKTGQQTAGLQSLKRQLMPLSPQERYEIAHSFALMLEIINSCEAAYRTYRLKQENRHSFSDKHRFGRVIHVLTAHPTESRNADVIHFFRKIQDLLERRLEDPQEKDLQELRTYLGWAWRIPMSKQRQPSVMDEAEYIYSLALQKEVIDLYVTQYQRGLPFYIRTWVGGDKDGHPGVDEKSMLGSLQMSRTFILQWLESKWSAFLADMEPLSHSTRATKRPLQSFLREAKRIRRELAELRTLRPGDAVRVEKWFTALQKLQKNYHRIFAEESTSLRELLLCQKVFPGLVVPLELREDSGVVHEALKASPRSHAIARMLATLHKLTPRHDARFYVKGFVLSNNESAADMRAGVLLVKRFLGAPRIPVVPLLESAHALENGSAILREFLKTAQHKNWVRRYWSSKLEVMVGYSDSAKENGSWASRYLIATCIRGLEKVISSYKFTPIFFHGSGGSIERGGGSVQEQTEWWPASALNTVKVTVQGEMIYRNYAAAEILGRQLERFTEARDRAPRSQKVGASSQKYLQRMAESVQKSYREVLQDPQFLELIEVATPYTFMKDLRLGSRPAKRQGAVDIKSLRAIPWVLCWTQTRSLFPTWWGVGSFWKDLSAQEKQTYRHLYRKSSLFSSYVKALGFTLAKVELDVFGFYLRESKLPAAVARDFHERFQRELRLCRVALRELSGEKSLLWYRPWLETSISLRSPLIHPLNVLQLMALHDHDVALLRETVTGVASGMLTTG